MRKPVIKKRLKYTAACLAKSLRLSDLYMRFRHALFQQPQAVILTYHRVIPREIIGQVCSLAEIIVYEDSFRKEMDYLSRNYHVISFDDFIGEMEAGRPLPVKTAIITFDDGWEDNYLYAFPILRQYNLPATIFLTSGHVGTDKLFWQEKLLFLASVLSNTEGALKDYVSGLPEGQIRKAFSFLETGASHSKFIEHLKFVDIIEIEEIIRVLEETVGSVNYPNAENSFLTWAQVKEMSSFLMTFGSHGVTHRILTNCTERVLAEELFRSRIEMEAQLQTPVTLLAYPNGNYNENVICKAKEAGYRAAVTVESGINSGGTDLFHLKRIHIYERMCLNPLATFSEELFALALAGIF